MRYSVYSTSRARTTGVSAVSDGTGQIAKRCLDVVGATIGVLILAPMFILVALAMMMFDRGPLFYGHTRVGRHGKMFKCLKFRTMRIDGDEVLIGHLASSPIARQEWASSRKLRDDPRITRLGRVLRKTSLDELPQLINVILGQMSLVGPRPIVTAELCHYGDAVRDYLSVRPGITGIWQVSGRSDLGYETRVMLDSRYVQTRNFWSDIGILYRTVGVVFFQRGSY